MAFVRKPNLFLVGHPRCGTTTLYHCLGAHPEVFLAAPKEPNFFCTDFREEIERHHGPNARAYREVRDLDEYLRLFEPAGRARVAGEASTGYLRSRAAAREIHAFQPEARIVAVLREPVSFLASLHAELVNHLGEPETDLARALEREPERRAGRSVPAGVRVPSYLHYSEWIRYAEQVGRYLALFPRERVKVLIHDDLCRDLPAVYRGLLEFLGVDPAFRPGFERLRSRRAPRWRGLNRLLRAPPLRALARRALPPRAYDRLQRRVQDALFRPVPAPAVPVVLAGSLRRRFLPEVERISELLERDLVAEWGYEGGAGRGPLAARGEGT